MTYLLLLLGLLLGAAGPVPGQQPRRKAVPPPDRRPYPHFRPAQHRKLKHYEPKTWRERTPTERPAAAGAGAAGRGGR